MSNKIGRNEPCYCGSGMKYKHCCLKNDSKEEVDNDKQFKKYMSEVFLHKKEFKKCYHSIDKNNCNNEVISSHSISKNSSLYKISEGEHVYWHSLSLKKFFNKDMFDFSYIFDIGKISIKKASTFYGFCKYHDNELFKDIDAENINIDERTAFLLGYRGFVREYYFKELHAIEWNKLRDFIKIPDFLKSTFNTVNENFCLSKKYLNKKIEKYFDVFKSKDYSSVKYLAFKFSNIPDILFAGAAPILYDFEGNNLENDINNLENITINAVSYDNGGIIIFQWFDGEQINKKFIDSLIKIYNKDKTNICNILVQFIFVYIENIFMRMSWWDNLDTDLKNKLSEYNNLHNIHIPVDKSLIPDGNKYCDWGNVDIISNIYLS
ncbi:YecA family protein [Brachyspira aalborgi]|uniref:SEC-C domain-containing protein n=1 Tax=Brachyspira aalborgi TaxID=29522 RepID=A0A5C8CJW5_9SPIR|nr:SEC-C domain-containing protein [Brachyspira aalborgi]TXJ12903.1 SEC-C domain-containing protein [Brachyspira aalborgi]